MRDSRANHLFTVALSKGLPWARWAMWMVLNDPTTEITAIALPSSDGRMALAAYAGVYLSDLQRSMWTRTLGGPASMPHKDDLSAIAIAISPTNPRIVVAGTTNGLYVSHDGGNTFSEHAQVSDAVYGLIWDATRPEILLAITADGVLQSSDGAKHFETAFATGEVRDVTLTADGAIIATGSGLHVITSAGDKLLLAGTSVVGAVPWQDGSTLVATDTALFVVGANGGRIDLLHATEQDPFRRLVGHEPFAYAMTASSVFRIGPAEKRVPAARSPPRLRLSLVQLERIVMRNTIETPEDTRLHDRWYAKLLPRVVVEARGWIDHSDNTTLDATFPVSYRFAQATSSAQTEWLVFATWDLSTILFGGVSSPDSVLESGLRATRQRIQTEVRTRYREAAALAEQLTHPPADPLTAFNWRMRLEELSAYLEALAGRQVIDLGTNNEGE